jgi:tetratricopeptide (TPR) repeat protein
MQRYDIQIDRYLEYYNSAVVFFRENSFDLALAAFDRAIKLAPTAAANFNRGLVLLSIGRWKEGFEPYESRLDLMTPPMCRDLELNRWRGQNIAGKNLLLVHDAGYGDTIMMLRYVPHLLDRGADVRLLVPVELERLADQVAPVTRITQGADFFCPMLSLLHLLDQTVDSIPYGPYLEVDRGLVTKWCEVIPKSSKRKIGIAWSIGRNVEGDYLRAIPLAQLVAALKGNELYSVQVQGGEEAIELGVKVFNFEDFADCAAFMSQMDAIVTVDTAAAHLAGAIGHEDVSVLLSRWASWRWYDNPFYPNFKLYQQSSSGDWQSALDAYRQEN